MKRSVRGFSLLEVISALALLSLLLLGVFYGIHTATHSVNSGTRAMERNDEARSVQQFLRRDLLQARALPWKLDAKGDGVVFQGEPRRMRFVAPLPGYLDRNGPQVQTLALVDDGKGALRLEMSSAPLAPGGPGLGFGAETLAAGLGAGHFRYYGRPAEGAAAQWSDHWDIAGRMPELVAVELDRGRRDANDAAWLWLQAPIRQSDHAINVGALAKALPDGTSP